MESLTQGLPSKSEKIRTLGRAGYSRRQIADFLGIRYQFVRNVLVDAERFGRNDIGARKSSSDAQGKPRKGAHMARRVEISADGEVRLPKEILDAAGTALGRWLLVRFEDDEIRLMTPEATTRRVQAMTRKFVPEGVNLADELIEHRRREVDREKGERDGKSPA